MERLTNKAWRNLDPWECCGQDKYCQRGCHDPGKCTKGCIVPQLYARLGAYEDTGLEPAVCANYKTFEDEAISKDVPFKRIVALMEADKAGRLVVLPVQPVLTQSIGSMLYIIEDGEIVEDSLCEALVGMGSSGEINIFYTTLSDQISFEQADIGKTVFLTRDAAGKALEAMKDGC